MLSISIMPSNNKSYIQTKNDKRKKVSVTSQWKEGNFLFCLFGWWFSCLPLVGLFSNFAYQNARRNNRQFCFYSFLIHLQREETKKSAWEVADFILYRHKTQSRMGEQDKHNRKSLTFYIASSSCLFSFHYKNLHLIEWMKFFN